MGERLTLQDFSIKFLTIKNMGWVTTHRSGRTGIGKTLEDLLGIAENNIQGPDFGEYELKSARKHSNSMLTLITKSPDTRGANTILRNTYGYSSDIYSNSEKVLHSTLNAIAFTAIANTGHKLKITPLNDKLYIEDENGITNIFWSVDKVKSAITKKMGSHFIYVKADSRGTGENEEFLYEVAYIIEGISADKIIELVKNGSIYVDLRIGQYPNGKTHDHGTGLRIKEKDHPLLFEKITEIKFE